MTWIIYRGGLGTGGPATAAVTANVLVVWKPERMVLHEVLLRVTADYEVPDPEGANVRSSRIERAR